MNKQNVLLVFQSKRGSARQAAEWIAEALPGCDLVDLGKRDADPANYSTVILGTGIFAGNAYSRLKRFIKHYRDTLLQKDIAIFITHLEEGEGIEKDFRSAFDADLLAHARVRAGVGGKLNLNKLNFFFRGIMKKMGEEKGVDFTNYDTLNRDACEEFARQVQAM